MLRFAALEERDAAANALKELGDAAAAAAAGGAGAAGGPAEAAAAAAGPSAAAAAAPRGSSAGGGSGGGASAVGAGAGALPLPPEDERRRLLGANAYLAAQYERLVRSGTITEPEFWRSPAVRKVAQLPACADAPQRKGLPNHAVAVQAAAHGGLNRLTFSLTRDEARQILEEKPHVKRAYLAQVGRCCD